MTSPVVVAYHAVSKAIAEACRTARRSPSEVTLVAVSKTHETDVIRPVLAAGHRIFGENRVQEAKLKWPSLRADFPDLELHLIGPLQGNKAAEAVALFDVIETIDRDRIAATVAVEMKKQGRNPKLFVQVNTGLEPQKAGIAPAELKSFLNRLRNDLGLTVSGLMCIPPAEDDPGPHFALLRGLAAENGIAGLSMGMSSDFPAAIAEGATFVRVGSAIFGARG